MKRPRYTRSARDDLRDILEYYSEYSERYAVKLLDDLIHGCRFAATHPGTGRDRHDCGFNIRSRPVNDYLVYFRKEKSMVWFQRVIHGARDVSVSDFLNLD